MLLTRARPDGGGAFTMKGLSPDRYRLSVTGIPEGCYLASAKIGEMDVLTDGMDLSGGPPGALELVLKGNAGRVSGLVKDGNGGPVPGARVALVPNDRQSLRLYRTATVDQYGRFNFASVPPGKYKLFAFDSVEEGAWMDPDFLRTVESKGAAVTVREGGAEVRELEAIP